MSQIMMMSHLLNINRAFSLFIQQEREINRFVFVSVPNIGNFEEVTALQVQSLQDNSNDKPDYNSKGKPQIWSGSKRNNCVCTHYGRTNHTIRLASSSMVFQRVSRAGQNLKVLVLRHNQLLLQSTMPYKPSILTYLHLLSTSLRRNTTTYLICSSKPSLLQRPYQFLLLLLY